MHKNEFCELMIGKPWSARSCSFDLVDCWGLVVLYFRHVIGVELHQTEGYESHKDFFTCYHDNVVFWQSVENPVDGCIFIGYSGDNPAHVGLVVNGGALHASGDSGCVRYDKLAAIKRKFTKLEFLRYASN